MRILGPATKFWSSWAVVSFAVAWVAWRNGWMDTLAVTELRSAAGIVAQIAATMLGFVLAAMAILATIVNTKLVRNMLRTGHYHVLLKRMLGAVSAFGLLSIVGLITLFIPTLTINYAYVLLGLVLWSMVLLLDVTRKFWTVLSHLHPDGQIPPG